MKPFGINRLCINKLGSILLINSSSSSFWTDSEYTLKSGNIWYKREINYTEEWFKLWFSYDAGANYEELVELDLTEKSNLIDLEHVYRHRIVDEAYHIDQTLTVTGYAGDEGIDWENIEVINDWSSYWTRTWLAQSEFIALYDLMTATLDDRQKAIIGKRIYRLKAAGLFQKADCIYFRDALNEADSHLNYVKDDNHCTKVGTPLFLKKIGWYNDDGSDALSLNYNAATDADKLSKDSACISRWGNGVITNNNYLFGSYVSPNQLALSRYTAAGYLHSTNSNSYKTSTLEIGDGLVSITRRSSAVESIKRNKIAIVNQNLNSNAIPSVDIYDGAANNAGVVTSTIPNNYSRFMGVFSGLTDAELELLYDIVFEALITDSTYVGALGDSTIAAFSTFGSVSSFIPNTDYHCFFDVAYPGDTVAQQKTRWEALPSWKKLLCNFVFVHIGLNDLNPAESAAIALVRYQDLFDTVKSSVNATCKIYTCTMTPCKARLIAVYGAVDGLTSYQKWLDMNEAIKGNGANAITGMDGYLSSHTDLLNDGAGNLAAAYDSGDGIHENDAGRTIIASVWDTKIELPDIYPHSR